MTKGWAALRLCAAMLFPSVPLALAAEEDLGFYDPGSAEGVTLSPVSAGAVAVEAVLRDVDGAPGDECFYPGSRALHVTLADTALGKMYLLTVSAGDAVLYADQQCGGGELLFNVAFTLPEERTALVLDIGSNAPGFARLSIPLFFTPKAESAGTPEPSPGPVPSVDPVPPADTVPEPDTALKTGYADCARDGACPLAAFDDLDAGSWYHDGVHFVLENRIMQGVGERSFSPGSAASRAMLVTMLWRMEGAPAPSGAAPFSDVPPDAWYADAVSWAASQGIVEGRGAAVFAPHDSLTREQLAAILWRFAKYKGPVQAPDDEPGLGVFIDAERISPWAEAAMQWAVSAGLITGVGNEKLSPEANATRAQVATVLTRFALASAEG